jgi:hypothetical protein
MIFFMALAAFVSSSRIGKKLTGYRIVHVELSYWFTTSDNGHGAAFVVPVRLSSIGILKADPGLDKAAGKYIMGRRGGCQGEMGPCWRCERAEMQYNRFYRSLKLS